ncbi:hypothetical protein [Schinkia azotoformans]|uniref:hypothetical protein n=1 Tax=Schinkia azotoformans TaxID=1454 RepID=UPI002DBDB21E|nr:hypothetical protein [Schinkia azotoformans]MEC1717728.1 hypothetical protein [Schinkia azotoformans]MEC1772599.1 hypothetical protein [Schinkia azotoformans]MED4368989.1 hypothetical protein [Schinkia azotoformans]
MQIYLSPEMIKNDYQLLNIVDQNNKPVGFLTFLFDEKKLYVFGQAENGVTEDFKDLVKPYIQGMKKSLPGEIDILCYLTVGGEKIDLNQNNEGK